ncbi:hypothetical protein NP233_g8478 [Leucocoprinus birnbaumii]|uniref:Uncharacterized protein n=1 Tax=Leucocoprinus birnbaumii TaxID=56174 RepID=A0AAD5VPR2_9AGAR|nr:hypothetical protein NP233_g8478 [Leucocoprinus birnbaumii]
MPNHIYSNFPTVSHNLVQFTRRASLLCKPQTAPAFIQFTLSGEYKEDDRKYQAVINVNENLAQRGAELSIHRDYDSAIGIADDILINSPMTVWAVPHNKFALKGNIHLKHTISYRNVEYQVPYHQIPNFELGNFANRHQVYVLFPKLWNPDLRSRTKPYWISERNRALWYASGMRPAIQTLLGHRIASDWPATLATEKARAQKTHGGTPGWTQKVIPKEYVVQLAGAIRDAIEDDLFLEDEDATWAKEFFFVHDVRGLKHGYYHRVSYAGAQHYLDEFMRDCRLVDNALQLGDWWIDVGIEISSDIGYCVQWATGRHRDVVQQALFIPDEDADRITSLSSSKYSRDLASHLSEVSGFRIEPGSARGPLGAVYVQAYTTDKAIVYNQEGSHHAKFLTMSEALSQDQPCKTINGLYDIYENAKAANSSNARLEIRVPWRHATDALMEFDASVIRSSLYLFTPREWWDFRLIRMTAISQALHQQAIGRTRMRFIHEALTLTAGVDLMDAALPVIEAYESNDLQLAYRVRIEDNDSLVAHIPFGCIFFRRINASEVPRLRVSGPVLPVKSFKFWFNGLDREGVKSKYQTTGFIDRRVIQLTRSTLAKRALTLPYINNTGAPEPDLFHVPDDVQLPPPVFDDGSDIEEQQPEISALEQGPLDTRLSHLWRQFVSDVTSKSPSPRKRTEPSYLKLTDDQRTSGSDEIYRTIRLDKIFRCVYYKFGTEEDWRASFDCMFPPVGFQTSSSTQTYGTCQYFRTWLEMLEENRFNCKEIEKIRDLFFARVFKWDWMPKAEADRMWATSVAKPSKDSLIQWPVIEKRLPAPQILLHVGEAPLFGPVIGEVEDEGEGEERADTIHLRREEEEDSD